ncbi:DUF4396 domain-containing protein [Vibrio viridaestus]|nr:DUF4396 domain-containing protein [Vibrio viridaestus]
MIPNWISIIAWISIILGFISAFWMWLDINRRPQHMAIMHWVWPLCGLFGHLLVVWIYLSVGRSQPETHHSHHEHHDHHHQMQHSQSPSAGSVLKGALHCGSGCTLGDIIAESLAFLLPSIPLLFGYQSLFDDKIFAIWILDFILAFGLGIVFQYFAIKPMGNMSRGEAIVAALKADFLSLTAWQIGMYGFMAIAHFWLFPSLFGTELVVNSAAFWLMMQIAMLCGLVTAFPVNYLLIRMGVKEAM